MNEQEQTGADIGQEQEQEQEQAAPTMADAARLLAVLAESRMIDAADVFADAAIELAQIAPAIIAEIVAAGIAGQTRQAPRESTIVPVNESGELECTCGSNQMSAAFGPDGVRINGAGHLVWEGVETTIDGPDWVAVVLTYGPDRRALETVRRRLAAEANACPVPGRCGLFLHAPDCPRRLSPLAAPEGWDVDYV